MKLELEEIQAATIAAMKAIDAAYDPQGVNVVFDEALLVRMYGDFCELLWSHSSRTRVVIEARIDDEITSILREITSGDHVIGNPHFNNEANGSFFDAFIPIGEEQYLVFNNTDLSMEEVKNHGNWKAAQDHLLNLAGKFSDPDLTAYLAQF